MSRKAKVEERARNCPKKKLSPLLCIVFRVPTLKKRTALADLYGGLAQLGERLPCKQEVSGSNPLISIPGSLAQLVRALA